MSLSEFEMEKDKKSNKNSTNLKSFTKSSVKTVSIKPFSSLKNDSDL